MTGLGDIPITDLQKYLEQQSSDSSLGRCLLDRCFASDITRTEATDIVKRWLETARAQNQSESEAGSAQQAESTQVLEELAPAWQPAAGLTGFNRKDARAAVAQRWCMCPPRCAMGLVMCTALERLMCLMIFRSLQCVLRRLGSFTFLCSEGHGYPSKLLTVFRLQPSPLQKCVLLLCV